jgi:adenylate cyclase
VSQTVRHFVVCLALALAGSVLMSWAFVYGIARPLTLQSSDLLFQQKPDTTARWSALVAMDDRTLAELRPYGRVFYWPRQLHAKVIENLKAAGARIVVYDVLFDAPGEGDAELEQAIRASGNVVLAEPPDPSTYLPPAPDQPHRWGAMIQQLPRLRDASLAVGHAFVEPDADGTVRAIPLIVSGGGQEVPALSLVAAAKFLRRPQVLEAPLMNGGLPFAGRNIPVDDSAKMWISYLGNSSEEIPTSDAATATFPRLSFVDVVNNQFSPDLVRGKLVFVGLTATGFADDYWTPVSRKGKMDGVEIHANAFETIMRPDQFIVPATTRLTILLIFAAGGLAFLAGAFLTPGAAAIILTIVAGAYVAAAVVAVDNAALLLDLPFPLLTQALCFAAILMFRIIFEQAQQRALKGAMSQYLSPDVMEEVIRDPGGIKLGGDKREMTVMFSDIRGFTTLSETLEPDQLVHLLNRYLTRMSDVIFKHQGTVDKYMGDAIMAFWGAPRSQPDHARLACSTAMEMVQELELLNKEFHQEGIPPLHMGVGLNTGPMAVGNMGSERRFDYTVMGDAVNLGSRLEGLNKEYGTSVIASEATLANAGDQLRSRFLDLVAVQGKREPAEVFELFSANGPADPARDEMLKAYTAGVECYRRRNFEFALEHFKTALKRDPDDRPSQLYRDRCIELLANPPPAEWDGVFVMTHK